MIEEIKSIVLSSPKGYQNILKARKDLLDYIIKMTPELDGENVNISTRIYWLLNDIHELPRCKSCGKIFHDRNANALTGYGNLRYCSVKCQHADKEMQASMSEKLKAAMNSPETKEKFRQTCLKKFGATSPLASKEIQEKIKKTNLEKFGVVNPLKNEEVRSKVKKTNLERYGAENPFAGEQVKEKIKETLIERYRVDNPNKLEDVKRKIEETELKKYGVKRHLMLQEMQTRAKETKQKKYGQNYEKIIEKVKSTSLEKYGFDNPEKLNGWLLIESFKKYGIIPLFSKEEYNKYSFKHFHKYKWKCTKCGNEFEAHVHRTMHVPEFPYLPRCLKCYPYLNGFSKKEKEVLAYVKSIYHGKIEENAKVLEPNEENGWKKAHELDIWLPELKVGIEFNGGYFHDYEKFPESEMNDALKKLQCEKQRIRLLDIWEQEWDMEKGAAMEKISSFLGNK